MSRWDQAACMQVNKIAESNENLCSNQNNKLIEFTVIRRSDDEIIFFLPPSSRSTLEHKVGPWLDANCPPHGVDHPIL